MEWLGIGASLLYFVSKAALFEIEDVLNRCIVSFIAICVLFLFFAAFTIGINAIMIYCIPMTFLIFLLDYFHVQKNIERES